MFSPPITQQSIDDDVLSARLENAVDTFTSEENGTGEGNERKSCWRKEAEDEETVRVDENKERESHKELRR